MYRESIYSPWAVLTSSGPGLPIYSESHMLIVFYEIRSRYIAPVTAEADVVCWIGSLARLMAELTVLCSVDYLVLALHISLEICSGTLAPRSVDNLTAKS